MPKDAPLAVEVPAPYRDKPGWIKVGVIAAVGFIVGIAWPRVMGVRLGPSAPGEAAAAAASASGSAHGRAPDAPPASVVTKGPASAAPAVAASAAPAAASASVAARAAVPPTISVQKGSVLSCKTTDGDTKKGKECGTLPALDLLVNPRVRKIASCSGIEGQTGKLSLVVTADFNSGKLTYDIGKSSTLPNVEAVTSCLKTTFHGTSTTGTTHEHPRYTVAYTYNFATPGGGDEDSKASAHKEKTEKSSEKAKEAQDEKKEEKSEKPEKTEKSELASGEASVAWEVALVRDGPKTGGLVSRLPRGTKVKVGPAKDGWFQIKFGEGYASEGWVYRGAIGR
jgi:hypothetical protein